MLKLNLLLFFVIDKYLILSSLFLVLFSDMAFFLFHANGSSFASRLNTLALIVLVLVCFCSYCSSSPSSLVSPIVDVDSSTDDLDLFDIEDEITYYTPLKLLSHHYRNVPEQAILPPSKNRFRNLLLKTALIYPEYRRKFHNNKRYASQQFHAMRG